MTLHVGTRLGLYEIQGAIGAGGMGEVYRATDLNLGREVAIKILPEAFAQDAERLVQLEPRHTEMRSQFDHEFQFSQTPMPGEPLTGPDGKPPETNVFGGITFGKSNAL